MLKALCQQRQEIDRLIVLEVRLLKGRGVPIPDIAAVLRITPDGVYKLLRRTAS